VGDLLANEEFLHWWTSRRSEVQEAFVGRLGF
jgi:hypothetical protein